MRFCPKCSYYLFLSASEGAGNVLMLCRNCGFSEKLDPKNGLVFTPTYDRLFNNGLITFTDSRALMISPLVSRETATRLHIAPNMEVDIPLLGASNSKRREYMDFHREYEFRR